MLRNIEMSTVVSKKTSRASSTSSVGMRPMSTIESSVTNLLVSTKLLLQKLTQWSKKQASEEQVSDAYVKLGNDFKLVSKQFLHAGIQVLDLGDVPMELRHILEIALREPATEKTINKYLPRIREIIVNLLDKLKIKQQQLKHLKTEQRISSDVSQSVVVEGQQGGSDKSCKLSKAETESVSTVSKVDRNSDCNSATTIGPSGTMTECNVKSPCRQKPISRESIAGSTDEDLLSQLKNGNLLQRRASKRYSAYHMAKLAQIGNNDGNIPTLPASTDFSICTQSSAHKNATGNTANEDGGVVTDFDNRLARSNGDGSTICVFLKLHNKVKKCSISPPLTFNQTRMLFVENLSFSPGGEKFPDIYIKDPEYDVAYQLEESQLHFIKDGTLLQLNIETPPRDIMYFEEKFEALSLTLAKSQQAFLNELKRSVLSSQKVITPDGNNPNTIRQSQVTDQVHTIKHDLSVLKQAHNTTNQILKNTINGILNKVKEFQSQSLNPSNFTNRIYMEKSRFKLSEHSDALLAKVDDLQDVIEALRKDVAIRGSKPSKKMLDNVQMELKSANEDVTKMEKYLNIEKPNWKKIWEAELDKVCEEQQFLTLQEDLVFDLKEDLNKANETFELVELCREEQDKNPKKSKVGFVLPLAKLGALNELRNNMLTEVESLNPNHEDRLQAIQRAEKLRKKELQYTSTTEFESELEDFVEKGNFKMSGGIEEIERYRREKDQEILNSSFRIGMI